MISQFLASVNVKNGSEIWLGGRQMDFHNFNWGDGSLFNYSYWEQGEPSFPAEKCIEMSWRNGRWNDINCRLKRAVLCERQVSSRHHVKPILYQTSICLESNCTNSSGAPPGVSQGASNPLAAPGNLANSSTELGVAQVMPMSEQEQQAASIGTRIAQANATSLDPSSAMDLPEDKPIKVISSIMNRDLQQQLLPLPALGGVEQQSAPSAPNATSASKPAQTDPNNTVFATHYNAQQPERAVALENGTQTFGSLDLTGRSDDGHHVQVQNADKGQKSSTTAAASQDAVNQLTVNQHEEPATVSLMNKIKPQSASTVASTTVRAAEQPAADIANSTAASAPRAAALQSPPRSASPSDSQSQATKNMSEPQATPLSSSMHAESEQSQATSPTGPVSVATAQEFVQVASPSKNSHNIVDSARDEDKLKSPII